MSMVAPIEFGLVNQAAKVTLDAVGAAIVEFSIGDFELIRRPKPSTKRNAFAGVTLAPWPNRLADANWEFDGEKFHGEINETRTNNRNHGLVFDREFDVVFQSQNQIVFQTEFGDDEVYPFKALFQVAYVLEPFGLHVEYSIQNFTDRKIPFAVGGHPYFLVSPESLIQLKARAQLGFNSRQLPTGEILEATQSIADLSVGKSFRYLKLDDCFTGLDFDAEGFATTRITHETNQIIEIKQRRNMPYLMVYTVADFGYQEKSGGAIAVEPLSAPPNALRTGTGLTWLEPHQVEKFEWSIELLERKNV